MRCPPELGEPAEKDGEAGSAGKHWRDAEFQKQQIVSGDEEAHEARPVGRVSGGGRGDEKKPALRPEDQPPIPQGRHENVAQVLAIEGRVIETPEAISHRGLYLGRQNRPFIASDRPRHSQNRTSLGRPDCLQGISIGRRRHPESRISQPCQNNQPEEGGSKTLAGEKTGVPNHGPSYLAVPRLEADIIAAGNARTTKR